MDADLIHLIKLSNLAAKPSIYCKVLDSRGGRHSLVKVQVLASKDSAIPKGIYYVGWLDFVNGRLLEGAELTTFIALYGETACK